MNKYNIYENGKLVNNIVASENFVKKYIENTSMTYELIIEPQKTYKEPTLDSLQQENKLLKAQLQAQTERSDFIEDCIAEMAGVIYNTEEITT